MITALPHTLLQIAQHSNGKLYCATRMPNSIAWEVVPLADRSPQPKYPVIDGGDSKAPRPSWAVDFYEMPVWELACLQYDTIS